MPKRRRKFSPEFKARVVLEVLTGVKTGGQSSRNYGIRPRLLPRWSAQFLENAAQIFEAPSDQHPKKRARIAELEGLAGRRRLSNDGGWAGISIKIGKGKAGP